MRLAAAVVSTLSTLLAFSATAQQGPDATVIFTRGARAFKALSSMQADFSMKTVDRQLGNEDSKGILYQTGTNKFAVRFSQPANMVFLIDGKDRWIYQPQINAKQVVRQPAISGSEYGVNYVAAYLDNPLEKYRLTYMRTESFDKSSCYVVMSEVLGGGMPFKKATVWFDVTDGLPRKFIFEEPASPTRTVELTKLQKNITISPDIFVFKVPAGVKIVGP